MTGCLSTFFEEARRSGVFELYYIGLATGLRRGELLGLKWSDIDLKQGIIHVRRQILRQNGKIIKAPLKTKNSYRNIAIGAEAIEVLRSMDQTSEYVFPSPYGGPMSPDSVLHTPFRRGRKSRRVISVVLCVYIWYPKVTEIDISG